MFKSFFWKKIFLGISTSTGTKSDTNCDKSQADISKPNMMLAKLKSNWQNSKNFWVRDESGQVQFCITVDPNINPLGYGSLEDIPVLFRKPKSMTSIGQFKMNFSADDKLHTVGFFYEKFMDISWKFENGCVFTAKIDDQKLNFNINEEKADIAFEVITHSVTIIKFLVYNDQIWEFVKWESYPLMTIFRQEASEETHTLSVDVSDCYAIDKAEKRFVSKEITMSVTVPETKSILKKKSSKLKVD
jgi:hypothetical protein